MRDLITSTDPAARYDLPALDELLARPACDAAAPATPRRQLLRRR